jgi:hypothetical protein
VSVSLVALAFLVLPAFTFAAGPWYVDDSASGTGDGLTPANAMTTIQAAIDAASPGDTIYVYPGNYNETATGRTLHDIAGTYQFGLFFPYDKPGLSLVGVDAGNNPITSAGGILAHVTTNGTADFGPDGVMVDGDNVTIQGIDIGANAPDVNKTVEVVADNFTFKYSQISEPQGGDIYINDFSGSGTRVNKYTITDSVFSLGATVDIASGAGASASSPKTDRIITNNTFTGASADYPYALISFNGAGGQPWYTYPVGGAVITGNNFSSGGGNTIYIRQRGTVADQSQFDWASYWNNNTFDTKVITTTDGNPANPAVYSYTPSVTYTNVRDIRASVQPEIDTVASAGNTLLVGPGIYKENINVNKSLVIKGAQAGIAVSGRTFGGANESTVSGQAVATGAFVIDAANSTIDGFSITDVRPLQGAFGIVVKSNGANAVIKNNILDTITTADTADTNDSTAQAIYLLAGPDGVQILNNTINNVHSKRSAKGILLGDNGGAASTDTTIQGNTITNVTSDTKGGYGIAIPNASADQTGLLIKGNTISALTGGWVHAIGVEGNASNINVNHNVISSLTSGGADVVGVWFESDPSFSSAKVNNNSLDVGATKFGIAVSNLLGAPLDGTCNWWGNASGPGGVGGGTGSMVTASTTFSPWLTTSNLDGNCAGGNQFKVHILKYLDGVKATSANVPGGYQFPMHAVYPGGAGDYVLGDNHGGAPDQYGADTAYMTAPYDYSTNEIVDTTGSQVVSSPELCQPGKYYLEGYGESATSFEDAATDLSDDGAFTGSISDQYIVVSNRTCPSVGSLVITKNTTGGDGTFHFTSSDIPGYASFTITTTGGTGSVTIPNLAPGTYHVTETVPSGWTKTDDQCSTVTVAAGGPTECTITNTKNPKLGEIRGVVYEDWDGDSKPFEWKWEERLSGWTVYIDSNNNNQLDSGEPTAVTNWLGEYRFKNLTANTYTVRVVEKNGWIPTYPSTNSASDEYKVVLAAGQIAKNKDFGSFKQGSISGMKFNDKNGNGRKDPGEPGLQGWVIQLKKGNTVLATTVTDSQGKYSFPNLGPGTYTVREVQQNGWVQKTPNPSAIKITSGKDAKNKNFGNKKK